MKKNKPKRKFALRGILLAAVTALLVASTAVFWAVSAADDAVSPADLVETGASQRLTAIDPATLGEPSVTMVTEMAVGEEISSYSLSLTGNNVYIDYGDGIPVEFPGDRTVKGSDMKLYGTITELTVCELQLTELDVSGCSTLTHLECDVNQLTELDVSKNTELTYLSCYENELTNLDVSKNTTLTSLECPDNELTELDVSKNTALTSLGCGENQLTELDISNNTALKYLECSINQLHSIDLTNNTALMSLGCAMNPLNNLDVTKLTSLTSLTCWDCQLNELDVSKNTALSDLSCDDNRLTVLDISKNVALCELSCIGNQLSELDISKSTALWQLICSENNLTELDLTHCPELSSMQCGRNQLTKLDVSKNTALENLSCPYNQLTELDISNNPSLEFLICYYNYLPMQQLYGITSLDRDWLFTNCFAPQTHVIPSSVKKGESIDLSSEYSIDGTVSEFIWYDSNGSVVVPATSEGGVFTFGDDAVGKTLVCKMTNAKIPDLKENGQVWNGYDMENDEAVNLTKDTRLTTTEVTILEAAPHSYTLKAGVSLDLSGKLNKPEDVTGKLTWNTSNAKVATVGKNGVVKAVAAGTATVTVTCGSYSESFEITVEKAVALSKYEVSLIRTTSKPSPTAALSAKKPSGVKTVVWTSDNPAVATVDSKGKISAISAGTAIVTCDDVNGSAVSAPCAVTVEDFMITNGTGNLINGQAYLLLNDYCKFTLPNTNHGEVTWKSSNAKVASVESDGTVTALKKGTVTVTAQSAEKAVKDTVKLTVVQPAEELTVNGAPISIYVGKTSTLKAVLSIGSNDPVFWTSEDESVATVDAKGKVKGVGQGETTVTATTFSGQSVTVDVTILTKATALIWQTIHPGMIMTSTVKYGIAVGDTLSLAMEITAPADSNDTIIWTTGSKKVASVTPSPDGKSAVVTGLAKGKSVITAKAGSGKKITATVSVVTLPAEEIALNKKSVSLYTGSTVTLSAKLQPKGCDDVVLWQSSDPSIATVDENGKVKAISQGTATVTAYSAMSGEIKDTAEVTVRTRATAIQASASSVTLAKGEAQTVEVALSPESTNDTVIWSTSKAKFATVEPSADGRSAVITGIAKGSATITAKTGSGKKITVKVTVTD